MVSALLQMQSHAYDDRTTLLLQPLTCKASDEPSEPAADQRRRDAPSIVLPHQQADFVRHIAIDIGGSLIKLVYFSPEDAQAESGDASEKGRNHAGGKASSPLSASCHGSLFP